eukprot:95110_1
MSVSNWSNMSIVHDLVLISIIICFCVDAQTIHPTIKPTANNSSDNGSTAFYEDVDTLKYIAIGGLIMVICCCLALVICVRKQLNKTEQGTKMQKYVNKNHHKISNNDDDEELKTNVITADGDENKREIEKEIYLVKIAERNEMGQKFKKMHKESMYDEQADEDEDFGH